MKKVLFLTMLLLSAGTVNAQKRVSATSPDGQTKVTVTVSDRIYYDVESHGVLTYEGVLGMEQNGSCKPDNSVWLPFLRNAVGPMDYIRQESRVSNATTLSIHMVRNGGWCACIETII